MMGIQPAIKCVCNLCGSFCVSEALPKGWVQLTIYAKSEKMAGVPWIVGTFEPEGDA